MYGTNEEDKKEVAEYKSKNQSKKIQLKSYQEVEYHYRHILFLNTIFQTLLATFSSTAAIFPAIDEQEKNDERQYYINAYLISLGVTEGINFLAESDILLRIFGRTAKREEKFRVLRQIFRHLRTAGVEIGVIAEFLRTMGSKAEIDWLDEQTVATRAIAILGLILLKTAGSFLLSLKEYTADISEENETEYLLSFAKNTARSFNRYSVVRYLANLPWSYILMDVTTRTWLYFVGEFGVPLNKYFQEAFPIAMGVFATIFNAVPDHPNNTHQKLKKISRFLDQFVKFAARNWIYTFMFILDLCSFIKKELNVDMDNSTDAILLWMSGFFSLIVAGIYFRLLSMLNDERATMNADLPVVKFILDTTKAMTWWIEMFDGNLAALPVAVLGSLAAFTSQFFTSKPESGELNFSKAFFLNLAKKFNDISFYTSLLVFLIDNYIAVENRIIAFPAALAFATLESAKPVLTKYPVGNVVFRVTDIVGPAIKSALLMGGSIKALDLVNPLGWVVPDAIKNILSATLMPLAFGGTALYLAWQLHKLYHKPTASEAIVINRSPVPATDNPSLVPEARHSSYVKTLAKLATTAAVMTIGNSSLKKFTVDRLDGGGSSHRAGNPEALVLLLLYIFLLLYLRAIVNSIFSTETPSLASTIKYTPTYQKDYQEETKQEEGGIKIKLSEAWSKFTGCFRAEQPPAEQPGSPEKKAKDLQYFDATLRQ